MTDAEQAARSLVLSVHECNAWYGPLQVLWNVELVVEAGEGIGIIGRNGAGKTTLLRTIAAVQRQRSAKIMLRGQDISLHDPQTVAKAGLSLVRENAPVFGTMTVAENLSLGATLATRRRRTPLDNDEVFAAFPVLAEIMDKPAGLLSGGQRQMLALGTALRSCPEVLMLDEPSAGLAPETAAAAFVAIRKLRETGSALVIAEQNIDWLEGVASKAVRIEAGRISGAPFQISELAEDRA